MYLLKRKDGFYVPSDDESYEASKKIKAGQEVKATYARNPAFHRKAFALMNLGHENSSDEPFEIYRMKLTIRSGYIHWTKDKEGKRFPLPKSLSYEKMSAEEFEKFYNDILLIIAKDLQAKPDEIQEQLNSF